VSNLSGGVDRSTYFPNQSPKVTAVVDMFGPTDLTQLPIYNWVAHLALFGDPAGACGSVPSTFDAA
jgi:hypothetical protein